MAKIKKGKKYTDEKEMDFSKLGPKPKANPKRGGRATRSKATKTKK